MIHNIDPQLSQWNVGRSVRVSDTNATHILFANQGDSKGPKIEIVDGEAKIPDYLLQTGKTLLVYLMLNGVTLESKAFPVAKQPRPEDYVYEDDQRNYIYELIASAEDAVKNANQATKSANTAAGSANLSSTRANEAATKATDASDKATLATQNANEATEKANEAATKANNAVKNMMVVGEAQGESIAIDNAIDQTFVGLRVFGKTVQNGTPTPDAPVELVNIGKGSITVNVNGENEAQSMTIATPNGLPGIPVKSGGNYTDANGQQWVCDEIDFARGVYEKRVGVIDYTDSSTISPYRVVTGTSGKYRFEIAWDALQTKAATLTHPLFCTITVAGSANDTWQCKERVSHSNSGKILYLYLEELATSTNAEALAWLKEKQVKILYQLATPDPIPLSETELATYAALHTYKDNTTVSNDAGAWMDIEYVMDAKKYIDNLVTGSMAPATIE